MTWHPDSCDCIIDVEKKIFIQRCKLHKSVPKTSVVHTHNRALNMRFGNLPTQAEQDQMEQDRVNEAARIRKLP